MEFRLSAAIGEESASERRSPSLTAAALQRLQVTHTPVSRPASAVLPSSSPAAMMPPPSRLSQLSDESFTSSPNGRTHRPRSSTTHNLYDIHPSPTTGGFGAFDNYIDNADDTFTAQLLPNHREPEAFSLSAIEKARILEWRQHGGQIPAPDEVSPPVTTSLHLVPLFKAMEAVEPWVLEIMVKPLSPHFYTHAYTRLTQANMIVDMQHSLRSFIPPRQSGLTLLSP